MKSDIFDDLTLLRRVSSKMEVEPYNRISALAKAVQLLDTSIKACQNVDKLVEHSLVHTGLTKPQFKGMLETLFKNLDVSLSADETAPQTDQENFFADVSRQSDLACKILSMIEELRESNFFGDIGMSRFEKEIIYRSDFMQTLAVYLEQRYGGIDLQQTLNSDAMQMIQKDKAVIGLLAMILSKRMFIIDDMEFVGKKRSGAFLTLD